MGVQLALDQRSTCYRWLVRRALIQPPCAVVLDQRTGAYVPLYGILVGGNGLDQPTGTGYLNWYPGNHRQPDAYPVGVSGYQRLPGYLIWYPVLVEASTSRAYGQVSPLFCPCRA